MDAIDKQERELRKRLVIGVSAVTTVVILYGAFIVVTSWPISLGDVSKAGVFGDSFGVLTSWFSGLAFAGIIFTIFLQKEELKLQREELKSTREVLQSQVKETKHQSFENTFFQMLRLHNDIVNSIDIRSEGAVTVSGRDCFEQFFGRLGRAYRIRGQLVYIAKHGEFSSEADRIESAYLSFWTDNQQDLGHYFRYLYTIFKFIHNSEVDNKKFYSNIIRSLLSDNELLVIFYNCLSQFGIEKFKPLVEEFELFDNLPVNFLFSPGHLDMYAPKAFGNWM